MPLLLPNLDDRAWADLADEGRALIPVYGPEWTDHNASDPGITLVELLAWITEMDIYSVNQVTDAERLRFLDLVGIDPRPPLPASAVLSLTLKDIVTSAVSLPQGIEFSWIDPGKTETIFQTTRSITLAPGNLVALQFSNSAGFQNLSTAWLKGLPLYPFGPEPELGAEFYLGLSAALPVGAPVSFYFTFGDGYSDRRNRKRILEGTEAQQRRCRCLQLENPCQATSANRQGPEPSKNVPTIVTHYGVRTTWEFLGSVAGVRKWLPLNAAKNEVVDQTRSFTLDGPVTFQLPSEMTQPDSLGAVAAKLCYLRCRFEAGQYDAAPVFTDVAYNGVRVVQTTPAASSFVIDAKCVITYGESGPPKPDERTTLRVQFDELKRIVQLDFSGGVKGDPEFLVLDYKAPAQQKEGCLTIEGVFLGYGNGFPAQQVIFPGAPVEPCSARVYTQEKNSWRAWELREDFFSSTRRDFHAVLDATSGTLTFGNGEHGRVPRYLREKGNLSPGNCLIFAVFETTFAQNGNLQPGLIKNLTDSPHNRALLYNPANPDGWTQLKSQLCKITNSLAAQGGAAAETVSIAAGRADRRVISSGRVVTLKDYEQRAWRTPGTRIARVTARANLHPDFPCLRAPGIITVIILPFLPGGRPVPTAGLLRAVSSYLQPRRVIGTRVEVVGPTYLQVTVNATVQSKTGADKAALQKALVAALNTFLDPLVGGPEGTGWPFGRDVYRAEIMRILSEVAGTDYVVSLALVPGDGPPQCGNVCLGPTWLVAAGPHQIQVL
jgi:hypothetical protein